MNGGAQAVGADLQKAGRIIKFATVAIALCWWLATGLGLWLALCGLDNLLRLPPGLRFPLALLGLAVAVVGFVRRVARPAARHARAERTALLLEQRYRIPDNLLINACQLESRPAEPGEARFVATTVEESARLLRRVPRGALWQSGRLRSWSLWAAAALVAWVLYAVFLPRQAGNALARFARPLEDIPPLGALTLDVSPARDVVVTEGDDLVVRAAVRAAAPSPAAPVEPLIVWKEGRDSVPPAPTAGDTAAMLPSAAGGAWSYTFRQVRRAFAFRVLAGDTYARCVKVRVAPLPRLRAAAFRVQPPAYTGRGPAEFPGPPAPLAALAGSAVTVSLATDRRVRNVAWRVGETSALFVAGADGWALTAMVHAASSYTIEAADPDTRRTVRLASGEIGLTADNPPQVDFVTEDRNRFVAPGDTVRLDLEASDDVGIRSLSVSARKVEAATAADARGEAVAASKAADAAAVRVIKAWDYQGPPGPSGPLRESSSLALNPADFEPGASYLIEALCRDFNPAGQPGRSRPVLLRIKSLDDVNVPAGDALAGVVTLLKKTIEEQRTAHAAAANLGVHLEEAVADRSLPRHRSNLASRQGQAQGTGRQAVVELKRTPDGARLGGRLSALVEQEMGWVLRDVARLDTIARDKLPGLARGIVARQADILNRLVALLGELAATRSEATRREATRTDEAPTPAVNPRDAARELKNDLENFTREQRRIVHASRSLADTKPEDLTGAEEKVLGDLAREEAQWARFFEEKLTDFSKLPMQDFADGSLSRELNEVFQEVQAAAKALYDRNVTIAVPVEQSGLEKAEQLVNNLERWLPDGRDNIKWLMEEPLATPDIPLADLPVELEDIVGELLDREEDMTEDVEDVTSSWMDSIDKGAGWDAMDGPISSMSAKGVTGNRLPNQMEIGGRSGEGRTGRSHGQMVESSAEGKQGRATPSRLTPSPFESGSVADKSTEDPGGATGGGKLSGHAGEGLRGAAPPPRLRDLTRLAGRQAALRQDAEAVALRLRAYHVPTGDLEMSIQTMQTFEQAARRGDGLGVRQAFSRILDSLGDARHSMQAEAGLHRETSTLTERERNEILNSLRDGVPRGYEDIVAAYFRALAERGTEGGGRKAEDGPRKSDGMTPPWP